jgi:hypothetical protein
MDPNGINIYLFFLFFQIIKYYSKDKSIFLS